MTPRSVTPPAWMIREPRWSPRDNEVWETLFTTGNGYLGVRGFPEEPFEAGPSTPGVLVAGLFDPGSDGVPELAPVPNVLSLDIEIEGLPARMTTDRISEYDRSLDLKRGLLRRSFVHRHEGRSTRLEFERFAGLANPHLIGQSVTLTPLDWRGDAVVRLWMGAGEKDPSVPHVRILHARHVARDRILLAAETRETRIRIAQACRGHAWVRQAAPPRPRHIREEARLGLQYEVRLEIGQRAVFERMVATYTSRDPETTSVERCCLQDLRGPEGAAYGAHRRRHVRRWSARWRRTDIAIDGPEDDQRAIRFNIFHLIQACPPRDYDVSIAAKGLSGPGYRGHVFWDTEIFMLPHFTWTNPRSARRLLEYRCRRLRGARKKAISSGYQGAMFPWESAATGDEVCPPYVPDPKTGRPVRVLTGELQHHISADVVYGGRQYNLATGDRRFRDGPLLVLAVETARFWTARVFLNRREGRYEIRDVIGPDEYHEHVDNNAYTNFLAAWNLRLAAEEVARLRATRPRAKVLRDLAVDDTEVDRWRQIADSLFLPVQTKDGLWEQHAGFFKLTDRDPRALSSLNSRLPEKARMRELNRSQVLKQPDVLMLMALFPERFSRKVRKRNWDYYEPRTTHDSSLSPCVHSIVAADLGLRGQAYEYFRRSAFIDLHDTMGNTSTGLHCAALGGTWNAVMRGFLGLQVEDDKPSLRPALPASWKRVRAQIMHRGRWYQIDASPVRAAIQPASR